MPAAYSFVTRWSVDASAECCWDELMHVLRADDGASWWPGLEVADVPARVSAGESMVLAVRSPLGYRLRMRLTITAVDPGRSLAAESSGDLRGRGCVQVDAEGEDAASVVFRWDVVTERPWMNATAFALRPAFEAAHRRVMRGGEAGLRGRLAS